MDGEGDMLAEYVAKVLIEDFNPDRAGDGGTIAHLTDILDQAITDLNMVCDARSTPLHRWSACLMTQLSELTPH